MKVGAGGLVETCTSAGLVRLPGLGRATGCRFGGRHLCASPDRQRAADRLAGGGLRAPLLVMQSSGGVMPAAVASEIALGTLDSGPTAGRSAVQVALKCLTTPLLLPINDGALSPVKVVLPPGRVVSATKPASLRWAELLA